MKRPTPRLAAAAAAVLALASLTTGLVRLYAAEPVETKTTDVNQRAKEAGPAEGGSARDAAADENAARGAAEAALIDAVVAEAADPKAEKATFIRRLSLDLTGLPPSADDVRAFVEDASPDAKAKLVDRLLASDDYQRRWRQFALVRPSTTAPAGPAEGQADAVKQDLAYTVVRNYREADRQLHAAQALEAYARAVAVADKQVKAAYMGVGVGTPDDTVRAQLKLAEGVGLVVNYVDQEGPSRNQIRPHDVLQKLDDQILVNAQQLVTLVRMHKPGEAVQVTVLREAKPLTVSIKLAAKDLPPLREYLSQAAGDADALAAATASAAAPATAAGPECPRDTATVAWTAAVMPAGDVVTRATRAGPVRIDDGEQIVTLLHDGGQKYVAVHDRATGKIKSRWAVGDDPRQWEIVPPHVRQKLNVLNGTIDVWPADAAGMTVLTPATQPAPTPRR